MEARIIEKPLPSGWDVPRALDVARRPAAHSGDNLRAAKAVLNRLWMKRNDPRRGALNRIAIELHKRAG